MDEGTLDDVGNLRGEFKTAIDADEENLLFQHLE